jgi:hypothetical protein
VLDFCGLFGLLFGPEDGSTMFFRNFDGLEMIFQKTSRFMITAVRNSNARKDIR